jgi:succinyl-CoA synthetase beta subunit
MRKQYGIGVPQGSVATTAAEAEAIATKIGGDDMVIKAQVLAGGRGKGTFDNGLKGGVRVIYSPTEARMFADQMIGHKLVTKQTGAAGRLCNSVYICERKFARREFYLAILMDRGSQGPVIVSSSQGGMDIETVAKESPSAITTTYIDIHKGVTDDVARKIATDLGFSEQCIEDAKDTIQKLYKIFMEKDATQIEINPLSETSDHKVLAMDAKLGFDDNAEFRQKEIFSWRDTTQEDPEEVRAAESGLNFIKLGGDIGCLVNGAGLAMATMDIIKLNGGEPANFLDVGGGATPQAIKEAFTLITSDPKVTAIFVNIFGGIVRCDAIAQGLISVVESMNLRIPIIARLQGTNMEAAHKLINESGLKIFSIDDLQSAAEKAVQFSKVVKMGKFGLHTVLNISDVVQHVISMLVLSFRWVFERLPDRHASLCVLIPSPLDDGRVCIMHPIFVPTFTCPAPQTLDMDK